MGRLPESTVSCVHKGLGDTALIITHHITACFPRANSQGQALCSVLYMQHLCWSSPRPVKVVLLFLKCGYRSPWRLCLLFKLKSCSCWDSDLDLPDSKALLHSLHGALLHLLHSLVVLMGLGPEQVDQHPWKLCWYWRTEHRPACAGLCFLEDAATGGGLPPISTPLLLAQG